MSLSTVHFLESSGMLQIKSQYCSGLRLSLTDEKSSSRYYSSIDLFSLGNSYADRRFEALQISNDDSGDWCINSRSSDILRGDLGGSIKVTSSKSIILDAPKVLLKSTKGKEVAIDTSLVIANYSLILPKHLPLSDDNYLSCDTNGNLEWKSRLNLS